MPMHFGRKKPRRREFGGGCWYPTSEAAFQLLHCHGGRFGRGWGANVSKFGRIDGASLVEPGIGPDV